MRGKILFVKKGLVDRRPDEIEEKKSAPEDVNQAVAQTVRPVTEGL